MDVSSLIRPEGIVSGLKVTSKKQALQEMSRYAGSLTGLHDRPVFDTLLERERLGTTGVGNGVKLNSSWKNDYSHPSSRSFCTPRTSCRL